MSRIRKGKEKKIDIRPLLTEITFMDKNTLELQIIATAGTPGIKVEEAISHILSLSREELILSKIKKTSWKQLSTG